MCRREGSCILEIHHFIFSFQHFYPKRNSDDVRQVINKMSNQVPSERNTFAYILLSDFQILQSQKKRFHIKNKIKRFIYFFTVKLTVKQQQQQITVIPMSASTPCIQYNEGTIQPFMGNQRQVEWD